LKENCNVHISEIQIVDKDFKCKCGFECNSLEALSWHVSECKNR
jgi:hypothetical protein